MSRRLLLVTFGSLGDLFPILAVGVELASRGHKVSLATCGVHREIVERAGLRFIRISPDMPELEEDPDLMRRIMHPSRGPFTVVREIMMPAVRAQFEELLPEARRSDLLLSHSITYGAPLAAEVAGIPWAAAALQPLVFFSRTDPPVLPNAPWTAALHRRLPQLTPLLLALVDRIMDPMAAPIHALRRELGLPRRGNPILHGQFSPHLNLALFSPLLAAPQPDWPPNTVATGFPFWDQRDELPHPPEVDEFFASGDSPIVFTLGSSAVVMGDDFYSESAAAASELGCRALLLVGRDGMNHLPSPLPPGVLATPYARHSLVFPASAAVVHHGGIGSTGQALRSGRPSLIATFSHDQPDNLERCRRLGVALGLPRSRYNRRTALPLLRRLLEEPAFRQRAGEVAAAVRREPGAAAAADALERLVD